MSTVTIDKFGQLLIAGAAAGEQRLRIDQTIEEINDDLVELLKVEFPRLKFGRTPCNVVAVCLPTTVDSVELGELNVARGVFHAADVNLAIRFNVGNLRDEAIDLEEQLRRLNCWWVFPFYKRRRDVIVQRLAVVNYRLTNVDFALLKQLNSDVCQVKRELTAFFERLDVIVDENTGWCCE